MPQPETVSGPAGNGDRLTFLLDQAHSDDKDVRDAAFNELYKYVAGPMKELVAACVRRQPGGPFQVTEAINDAVGTLFLKWTNLAVADTSHFRALVVQAVYWKVAAQRRANRRLREAVTDQIPAPRTSASDFHAQDRFEEAVEALAEHERRDYHRLGRPAGVSPTPLSDVVKARHLIGITSYANDDDAEGAMRVTTFKAVGELLGVDPTAACKWYWKALEWLHKNFPDVVPVLPERKKAGRKKNSDPSSGGEAP